MKMINQKMKVKIILNKTKRIKRFKIDENQIKNKDVICIFIIEE